MSRLQALIDKLESGEPVTQEEVNRVSTLIALDTAVLGETYVQAAIGEMKDADESLRQNP